MNTQFLPFIFFALFTALICNPVFGQEIRDKTFIGNNEGLLQIKGTKQHYEFISQEVSARIDINENLMEFIIPLKSFAPVEDLEHQRILNDIFSSPFRLPLYLTATFDEEVVRRENFTQPVNVVLNGTLSLYEEHFQVPVEVSIYAVDETVFYNMVTRFDLSLLGRDYDGIYKDIITGEFMIIVNDAQWNRDFSR